MVAADGDVEFVGLVVAGCVAGVCLLITIGVIVFFCFRINSEKKQKHRHRYMLQRGGSSMRGTPHGSMSSIHGRHPYTVPAQAVFAGGRPPYVMRQGTAHNQPVSVADINDNNPANKRPRSAASGEREAGKLSRRGYDDIILGFPMQAVNTNSNNIDAINRTSNSRTSKRSLTYDEMEQVLNFYEEDSNYPIDESSVRLSTSEQLLISQPRDHDNRNDETLITTFLDNDEHSLPRSRSRSRSRSRERSYHEENDENINFAYARDPRESENGTPITDVADDEEDERIHQRNHSFYIPTPPPLPPALPGSGTKF